jgi:DHA2 family multidrug resistance protein
MTMGAAPLGLLSPAVQPEEKPQSLSGKVMLGLAGVVLAAMLSSLDQRFSSSANADLLGGLGLGQDEGSWLATAYAIGNIAVVPFTPWLAQLLSPRRVIAAEIVLFVLAGAAVPSAGTYAMLVGLRFLQGFGQGGLTPLMLLVLLRTVPPRHRPEGFAVYAMVSTLVPLAAEPLAGIAVELLGWQTLFWITPILGPVALLLILAYLPIEDAKWETFLRTDYFGLASLVVFACLLVTGLSQGQRLDWFDDRLIVALFAGAGAALLAFLVSEAISHTPLLDLSLFRRRNFSIGLVMVGVFNIGLLGATFLEPQTQMLLRGLKPEQIGDLLLVLAGPQLLLAPLTALAMRVLDARLLVATGFAMGAIGAYLCTYYTSAWSPGDFLWPLLLQACGWPITFVPLVFLTVSVLKPEDALTGGTIFNIVRTLAIAAGPAVVNAIVTVRERVHSVYVLGHVVPGSPATDARLAAVGQAALIQAARAQSYVLAYADAFGWISVLLTLGVGLVLFQTGAPVTRRRV